MRRVELLRKRLQVLEGSESGLKEVQDKASRLLEEAHQSLDEVNQIVSELVQAVAETETTYQEKQRQVRPHSRLAQNQARLASCQKRQKRRETTVKQAERRFMRHQKDQQAWQNEVDHLRQRLKQFEEDNLTNTAPIQIIFRLDAGFGTIENIALFIEMGYKVYSKPHGNWLTGRLENWINEHTLWKRVGQNAEMVAWPAGNLPDFPSGILLLDHIVAFSANFVRWATLWLTQDCGNAPEGWLDPVHPQVKQQVKIGAQSLAWVSWYEQGCMLRFEDHSVFAGRSLNIKKHCTFQPVLPFAKSCFFL